MLTIVRLTKRYETAVFLFIALGFYTFFFNGARQGIAAAICFFALPWLLERKPKQYFLLVGLAFLFHKTALWAAIPKHSLTEKVLSYYDERVYTSTQETNTASVSRTLIDEFGIDPNYNALQIGDDGKHSIHIYPAEYFCLDLLPNFATHHFEGSWVENKQPFKEYFHAKHHLTQAIEINGENFHFLNQLAKNISFKGWVKVMIYKMYHFMPERVKELRRRIK